MILSVVNNYFTFFKSYVGSLYEFKERHQKHITATKTIS